MNGLLELVADAYQRNIGNPARQLVGNGVRGLLGLDMPEYADNLGREAYRTGQALGNVPGVGAPAGAFKAAAKVVPEAAMFIGALAKTWDKASNAKAVQMEKAGKDAREIWRETGNLKGPDGKWRQEIDDSVSVPGQRLYSWGEAADLKAQNTVPVRRQKALLHPPLSAAYPDTKQIGVLLKPGSPNGAYVADTDWITVGAGKNGAADRSLMLHELQHAVQKREGFASGGAPSEFATGPMFDKRASDLASEFSQNINGSVSTKPQEIIQTLKYGEPEELKAIANRHGFATVDDAVTFLANEDARRTPLGQYRRLAGEAEARATQARMNMTPAERRATFPYDSYDVPVDQLIVRGLLSR